MNVRFYSCILLSALPYLIYGNPLREDNAGKCTELCTGCDGTATFENGYCECQIDNDNKKGADCVNKMRRQAGELGMDLVSCDELGGDRRARCLLASRRRFGSADADLVANYFKNGGALAGISPFGSNSLLGANNDAQGSYKQIGTNNQLMSATDKAQSSPETSNLGQKSVVDSQSSKSSGTSPIVSQTHQYAFAENPVQSVAMNNPLAAASNMQFANAPQANMVGAANPWSVGSMMGNSLGNPLANPLGNPLANPLGNPLDMLGKFANPNALMQAGAAMLNPNKLQAMSNMLLGLGNVPGLGMIGAANPMATSGNSLDQQMVGAAHEEPNQTNMVGSAYQNMVGNAPLGAACLGSSHPQGSNNLLGASNPNEGSYAGELHEMPGQSSIQNSQLGASVPSYTSNTPQFGLGNPQLGAGIPSRAFNTHQFGVGNPQLGAGIPSYAFNGQQFGIGNPQLGAGIPSYTSNGQQFGVGNPQLGAGIPSYTSNGQQFGVGNPQLGAGIPSYASNMRQFGVGNPQLGSSNFQNQPMAGYYPQHNSLVGSPSRESYCADQSSILGQQNQNASPNNADESQTPIVAKSKSDTISDPETPDKSKNSEKKLKKSLKDSKLGASLSKKSKDMVSAPNPDTVKKSSSDKEIDSQSKPNYET